MIEAEVDLFLFYYFCVLFDWMTVLPCHSYSSFLDFLDYCNVA